MNTKNILLCLEILQKRKLIHYQIVSIVCNFSFNIYNLQFERNSFFILFSYIVFINFIVENTLFVVVVEIGRVNTKRISIKQVNLLFSDLN